jgi:hypothetical protein
LTDCTDEVVEFFLSAIAGVNGPLAGLLVERCLIDGCVEPSMLFDFILRRAMVEVFDDLRLTSKLARPVQFWFEGKRIEK